MIYPAAKVVLIDRANPGKLLLIYREVNGHGGYEAAGGRIEVNFNDKSAETFEMCALREIKEEVGVDAKILEYLGSYTFFWDLRENTCSSCVVFLGEIIGGEISSSNLDKSEFAHETKWVDINDIKNNKIPLRDNHIGLHEILIKAVNSVLKSRIWDNVYETLSNN